MNEYANEYEVTNKMSSTGVVIKSIIGLIIAFGVAIPRLFSGNYFGETLYSGGFFSDFILVTIFTIVIGIIWFTLYKSMMKDKGTVLNWIVYIATMFLLGLFFGNALIVAVSWISYYADISEEMVVTALRLAALGTFFAVLAGIILLPKITLNGRTARVFENLGRLIVALFIIQGVMAILALFLNIFGLTFLWDIYGSIFYGANLFSIFLTFITSVFAVAIFVGILGTVKYQLDKAPKHMEFYFSALLVNGLVRIYIEIFKLVLKILARREQ